MAHQHAKAVPPEMQEQARTLYCPQNHAVSIILVHHCDSQHLHFQTQLKSLIETSKLSQGKLPHIISSSPNQIKLQYHSNRKFVTK
eukprot:scaffold1224_cov288-Chaetoceros_neogracile.AAC.18